MSTSSDLSDTPAPGWTPDILNDYFSLLNTSIDNLDMTSPQPSDSRSNSQTPSPPPPDANSAKLRKRGRPRLLDSKGAEIANKERRKAQVRLAQRAFRERKEEKLTTLSNRVAELEQKLMIARSLYLSTHAAVMNSELPLNCNANNPNWRLLHDNLQLLLANTELQNASTTFDLPSESVPATPSDESFSYTSGNSSLGQVTPPGILTDKDAYMLYQSQQLYPQPPYPCLSPEDMNVYGSFMTES